MLKPKTLESFLTLLFLIFHIQLIFKNPADFPSKIALKHPFLITLWITIISHWDYCNSPQLVFLLPRVTPFQPMCNRATRSSKNMWSHVTHSSTLATFSITLRVKAEVVRVAHMVCFDLSPHYFSSALNIFCCAHCPCLLTSLFLNKQEILLPQVICINIFSAVNIPSFPLNIFSAGITLTYLWCKLFLQSSTPYPPDFNFYIIFTTRWHT